MSEELKKQSAAPVQETETQGRPEGKPQDRPEGRPQDRPEEKPQRTGPRGKFKGDPKSNPLGTEPIGKLMTKFAIPSIIAMLVGSVYNIVDQLFIGHMVGPLGNAATNVAFPFTTVCIALSLLFGIGAASCFNLAMGEGSTEKAGYYIGNGAFMLTFFGVVLLVITELFCEPLLKLFGSPEEVMPYALAYTRVVAIGFPFLLLTTGGGHLIRADGSPKMTMFTNVSGAVINVFLDALFVVVFKWGMAGAAFATILGQIFSGIIVLWYLKHWKTIPLLKAHFVPSFAVSARVASIGCASFFNQLAILLVQVVMNNTLLYYGSQSVYGASIPIACCGIVMKVNMIFFSICIGIAQGSQPIESFNYGARQFDRVRGAYFFGCVASAVVSFIAFAGFQLFPKEILLMFGNGSPEYIEFGTNFFRLFLKLTCVNFLQPMTATLFTSIGKPIKGVFLSLTRQCIFFIPLLLVLPLKMGILGVFYVGPIADGAAMIAALVMAVFEFRAMKKLEAEDAAAA